MSYIRVVSTGNRYPGVIYWYIFFEPKNMVTSLAVIYIEKKLQLKSKNKEITRIKYSVLT